MTALRCAGCGCAGEPPKIRWDKSGPEPVVLRPTFGWHQDQPGKPALLCDRCRDRFRKQRVFKPGRGR